MHSFTTGQVYATIALSVALGVAATSLFVTATSDGGSQAVKADLRDGVARVCETERTLSSVFEPHAAEAIYRCAGARDAAWVVVTRAGEREAGL